MLQRETQTAHVYGLPLKIYSQEYDNLTTQIINEYADFIIPD